MRNKYRIWFGRARLRSPRRLLSENTICETLWLGKISLNFFKVQFMLWIGVAWFEILCSEVSALSHAARRTTEPAKLEVLPQPPSYTKGQGPAVDRVLVALAENPGS